jgi:hypothetical protein
LFPRYTGHTRKGSEKIFLFLPHTIFSIVTTGEKIAPRSSHPKGDEEKREEYKALVFPPTGDKGKD